MQESKTLEKLLKLGRKVIPSKIFKLAQPAYHYFLAMAGAVIYRFPGKNLVVVGVTGTKGKTTTVELVNSILETAGCRTALASTLRYKIGDKEWRNMFKMTLRGRFFTQKFLRQAVATGCTHAIIEISSEGVSQFRHKFLFIDALLFTNLAPEHIESHGSYENYVRAKLQIAKELEGRKKRAIKKSPVRDSEQLPRSDSFSESAIIVNADDKEGERFLELNIKNKIPYSLRDAIGVRSSDKGSTFQVGKAVIHSSLPGIFNIYNMLAAISYAKFIGISDEKIKEGLEKISFVRGRMEKIEVYPNGEAGRGQDFDVVVDYAHTPESLRAVYETYNKYKKICILGNTGGGRDKWKREEMGKIANKFCDEIILTNEDPYDEDPVKIVEDIKKGIKKKPCQIVMDRREAIRLALSKAKELAFSLNKPSDKNIFRNTNKVAVLITGKGTDPYIMGPNGTKQEWDDASVAREELQKVLK